MKSDYYLQLIGIGAPPRLDLTESQFHAIAKASEVLSAAFYIEENFELLLGNYIELESSALSIAASSFVRQPIEYADFSSTRVEMNRRAVNLLSTARLYIDQLPSASVKCQLDAADVKRWFSEQYDGSFEYRFMEALRNHVQHSGSAIHFATVHRGWLPKGGRERLRHNTVAQTLRRFLDRDGKFKKATLNECPEKIDFLQVARPYIEALWRVHTRFRQQAKQVISESRSLFEETIRQYGEYSKSSTLGLTAFACQGDEITERVSVFLDWDDVRIKLERRNSNLINLSKYEVSTAPLDKD